MQVYFLLVVHLNFKVEFDLKCFILECFFNQLSLCGQITLFKFLSKVYFWFTMLYNFDKYIVFLQLKNVKGVKQRLLIYVPKWLKFM